jgi:hypothetical protein
MTETNLMRSIMAGVSQPGTRIFRQNVGTGWTGDVQRLADGSILIRNPRPLQAGLCKGSSDLIGWRSVEVTPEMVGRRLALFLAIEVKGPKGRATDEQRNFIDRVRLDGGLAGIARCVDDALGIASPTI